MFSNGLPLPPAMTLASLILRQPTYRFRWYWCNNRKGSICQAVCCQLVGDTNNKSADSRSHTISRLTFVLFLKHLSQAWCSRLEPFISVFRFLADNPFSTVSFVSKPCSIWSWMSSCGSSTSIRLRLRACSANASSRPRCGICITIPCIDALPFPALGGCEEPWSTLPLPRPLPLPRILGELCLNSGVMDWERSPLGNDWVLWRIIPGSWPSLGLDSDNVGSVLSFLLVGDFLLRGLWWSTGLWVGYWKVTLPMKLLS